MSPDSVPLLAETGEHLIGPEAAVVERMRRVRQPLGRARRQHLLPRRVALAPEGGAPRSVQRGQAVAARPVAAPQPAAEGARRVITPADGAVFVVHMPHGQGGMSRVALRERAGHPGRRRPVGGRRRAVGIPAAVPEPGPVPGHRHRVRMGEGEPRRRRRRGGGEHHPDSVTPEPLQRAVQPAELIPALVRFQDRPGEHADRRGVHPGLAH